MSRTNATTAFLARHRHITTICAIAIAATLVVSARAGAALSKSTTLGKLVVKIETVGGPPGVPNTAVAGHAVFIARTGARHDFAITASPRTVTLPIGRYRAYATSPKYDSGTARCDPAKPVIVSRVRRPVVFYCQLK